MRAQTLIENHIAECLDTRRAIMAKFDEGTKDREKMRIEISAIVNRGLIYIIGILILAVGYFLVRFGLPGHA